MNKEKLFSYVVEGNLDLICITEAWVNDEKFKESRKEYKIDGYTMYLSQRAERMGGGVVRFKIATYVLAWKR